jgi:hypothetical protein
MLVVPHQTNPAELSANPTALCLSLIVPQFTDVLARYPRDCIQRLALVVRLLDDHGPARNTTSIVDSLLVGGLG